VRTLLSEAQLLARNLAKVPSFTGRVLLTLAIGIGATVAPFSVANSDGPTYVAVPTAVATLASWLPARHASSLDPAEALAAE
jgi:ABC-type lipoprotein release transport system permease subunit